MEAFTAVNTNIEDCRPKNYRRTVATLISKYLFCGLNGLCVDRAAKHDEISGQETRK